MRNCSQCVSILLALGLASFAGAQATTENKKRVEVKSTPIQAPVRFEFSRLLRPGQIRRAQTGRPGQVKRTFEITVVNGRPVRELVSEERIAATPTIYHMSPAGFGASRGSSSRSFTRAKVKTMRASAYTPMCGSGTGRTANGMRAGFGHVAVDRRVIPLGTLLFVEGYGFAIASDTGGAIRGNKIDLCVPTRRDALAFGRRTVTVHVLRPAR